MRTGPLAALSRVANFVAEFPEFLSVRAHQQVLRVVSEKFAGL